MTEKEYIEILEREGRHFADLLHQFAKTNGELRKKRNELWLENVELKRMAATKPTADQ